MTEFELIEKKLDSIDEEIWGVKEDLNMLKMRRGDIIKRYKSLAPKWYRLQSDTQIGDKIYGPDPTKDECKTFLKEGWTIITFGAGKFEGMSEYISGLAF